MTVLGELISNFNYKSPKVSSFIVKNNLSMDPSPVKQTNVVYQYKCTHGDCARQHNSSYIGLTTTTLGRRITMHLQDGGPKRHLRDTCEAARAAHTIRPGPRPPRRPVARDRWQVRAIRHRHPPSSPAATKPDAPASAAAACKCR